jgi:peptidoglycan hydrolase CwlO-like protein
MTTHRTAERDAIQAAMQRLLAGTPTRSTGALTVVQLAAEAGVKRWVLTHKHPDLRKEFEAAQESVNGIPTAFQTIQAKVDDLQAANRRLRERNNELTERNEIYAQVIHALTTELTALRQDQPLPTNVRRLPTDTTASPWS